MVPLSASKYPPRFHSLVCEELWLFAFEGGLREDEQLFETLQALVRCGWNQRETARELQVHYNTVRYRYERICELTGDLSTPEKQVEVSVALHLCRLNPDLCRPETSSPPLRNNPVRRGLS